MSVTVVIPVYDAAGSLVCDGDYYFQYGAWYRVVLHPSAED